MQNERRGFTFFTKNLLRPIRNYLRNRFFFEARSRKIVDEYRQEIVNRIGNKPGGSRLWVLDLGANVGHFSRACRNLGFSVIAVEPHPQAFAIMRRRFKGDSKIVLINAAVSDQVGHTKLHLHSQEKLDPITASISATLEPSKFQSPHDSVNVSTVTLGKLLELQENIYLLKLDIEGGELILFPELIKRAAHFELLFMETHARFMDLITQDKYSFELGKFSKFIHETDRQGKWFCDWL